MKDEPRDGHEVEQEAFTAETVAEYERLRRALSADVIGRSELLDRLALVALVHSRGLAPQRLLLTGPSGVGKTHIAAALSRATGNPFYSVDSTTIVEAGWAGTSITDFLTGWAAREGGADKIARGVLVLDEVDKLRVHPQAENNAIPKALGTQSAVLSLLGVGTPVRLGGNGSSVLDPAGLLVIACGAFSDAQFSARGAPTSEELTAYGFMAELVDRLPTRLYIPVPDEAELICRFRTGSSAAAVTYTRMAEELGYRLAITDPTYVYAARWVLGGGGGLREGGARVAEAAANALARALRGGLPPGTTLTVTPDDLEGMQSSMALRRQ